MQVKSKRFVKRSKAQCRVQTRGTAMKFFLLVFFTAIASPALAADQVDLVCTSTEGSADRYRTDLTKGAACSGNCDRIWKMGEATTGEVQGTNKRTSFTRRREGDRD